jgi:glc operon protein GlcG
MAPNWWLCSGTHAQTVPISDSSQRRGDVSASCFSRALWVAYAAGSRSRASHETLQKRLAAANSANASGIRHTLRMAQSYGPPIRLNPAKQAAAAALAEARNNHWTMVVAVVDTAGELVYFEKMDDAQNGSVKVAVAKARSAALFKRPTKAFQDALTATGDGLRILGLDGAVPVEGGVPLVVDGQIVGAIGVSGGTSQQDGECAKAGVGAV